MIGVFGASLGAMQVHLTLMLVFVIILITAVVQPLRSSKPLAGLFQRLEILSLAALFCTLWAAAVFSTYPKCKLDSGDTGNTLAWCEVLGVVVGGADMIIILLLIGLFFREKGILVKLSCCGSWLLPTAAQGASPIEVENPLSWSNRSASANLELPKVPSCEDNPLQVNGFSNPMQAAAVAQHHNNSTFRNNIEFSL